MISDIGILTAFVAGVVSFLSPCVPGYISYVSGNTLTDIGRSTVTRFSALGLGFCFVLGFSSVFVVLGATATALSRALLYYRYEANLAGGAVIILFGIFMTGLVPMPWLQRDARFHGKITGGRPVGAYLLGLAFGFGWTPCIGPILGAILTVSAVSSTALTGIVLLSVYALGLGLPFLPLHRLCRRTAASSQRSRPPRPLAPSWGGRRHGHHGSRHDYRYDVGLLVLAARKHSYPREDWLK